MNYSNLSVSELERELVKELENNVSSKETKPKASLAKIKKFLQDNAADVGSAVLTAASVHPAAKAASKLIPLGLKYSPQLLAAAKKTIALAKPTVRKLIGVGSGTLASKKYIESVEYPNWKDQIMASLIGTGAGAFTGGLGRNRVPRASLAKKDKIITDALEARKNQIGDLYEKYGSSVKDKLKIAKTPIPLENMKAYFADQKVGFDRKGLKEYAGTTVGKLSKEIEKLDSLPYRNIQLKLEKLSDAASAQGAGQPGKKITSAAGRALLEQEKIFKDNIMDAIENKYGPEVKRNFGIVNKIYSDYANLEQPHITEILKQTRNLGEPTKLATRTASEGAYIPSRILNAITDPKDKQVFAKEVIKSFSNNPNSLYPDKRRLWKRALNKITPKEEHQKEFYKAKKPNSRFYMPVVPKSSKTSGDVSLENLSVEELEKILKQELGGGREHHKDGKSIGNWFKGLFQTKPMTLEELMRKNKTLPAQSPGIIYKNVKNKQKPMTIDELMSRNKYRKPSIDLPTETDESDEGTLFKHKDWTPTPPQATMIMGKKPSEYMGPKSGISMGQIVLPKGEKPSYGEQNYLNAPDGYRKWYQSLQPSGKRKTLHPDAFIPDQGISPYANQSALYSVPQKDIASPAAAPLVTPPVNVPRSPDLTRADYEKEHYLDYTLDVNNIWPGRPSFGMTRRNSLSRANRQADNIGAPTELYRIPKTNSIVLDQYKRPMQGARGKSYW